MAALSVEVHDGPVVQAVKFVRAYWPLLLPAFLVFRFLYYRYTSPLRHYPGPFLASGSRAWKVWSTYSGKTETDHINLHERYGMPFAFLVFITWDPIEAHLLQARSFALPRTSSLSPLPMLLAKC